MRLSAADLLTLAVTAAVLAFVYSGYRYALRRMTDARGGVGFRRGFRAAALSYLAAVAALTALSLAGFFSAADSAPPRGSVFFALILTCTIALAAMRVDGGLHFLTFIPPWWVVAAQSYRVPVEVVLLMLYRGGLVPRELTWEGRNFDVLVGATAPLVGYMLSRGGAGALRAGVAWNVFGLLSLLNIVSVAVLSIPSQFRVYATNYLPTYFPGILIPALLAPLAVYLHVLSLKQLAHAARARGGSGA